MTDKESGADASLDEEQNALNEPEETEVEPEETEQEETSSESEAESPPADEENVEETNPIQERIDKLTRNWRETQRQLEAREQELQEMQKRLTEAPQREPEKTLEDFDYDQEKFLRYSMEQAEKRAAQAAEKAVKEYQKRTQQEQVFNQFVEREKAFAKDKSDYHEVVSDPTLRITPTMAGVIRESEIGPEVAYYLGKHPDEAASIAALPDSQSIRRIVELEARFKAAKSKTGEKVSKAPPPPKKIKAENAKVPVSSKDPKSDDLSDAEWFRLEEKRLAKSRG